MLLLSAFIWLTGVNGYVGIYAQCLCLNPSTQA